MYPNVLTVLNTATEAERNTQNNKDKQGLLPDDCVSMKLRVVTKSALLAPWLFCDGLG